MWCIVFHFDFDSTKGRRKMGWTFSVLLHGTAFCELRKLARYVGRYEISSSISSVLSAFCTLHRRWRCWRELQTKKESIGLERDSMVLRRHGALVLEIGQCCDA